MSNITVTPEEVIATANQIKNQGQQMSDEITAMVNQVQNLLDGWKGLGANAFNEYFSQLQQAANTIVQDVDQMSSQMITSANNYTDTDNTVAGSFQHPG
jgi:WXG100 family type VII secretion target